MIFLGFFATELEKPKKIWFSWVWCTETALSPSQKKKKHVGVCWSCAWTIVISLGLGWRPRSAITTVSPNTHGTPGPQHACFLRRFHSRLVFSCHGKSKKFSNTCGWLLATIILFVTMLHTHPIMQKSRQDTIEEHPSLQVPAYPYTKLASWMVVRCRVETLEKKCVLDGWCMRRRHGACACMRQE